MAPSRQREEVHDDSAWPSCQREESSWAIVDEGGGRVGDLGAEAGSGTLPAQAGRPRREHPARQRRPAAAGVLALGLGPIPGMYGGEGMCDAEDASSLAGGGPGLRGSGRLGPAGVRPLPQPDVVRLEGKLGAVMLMQGLLAEAEELLR